MVSLTEELGGWKLGHDGSEDLIAEGRENFLLVVFAQFDVDGLKHIDFGVEKHLDWQFDALHISVSSLGKDLVLSGLHVVDDWFLD